MKFALLSLSVLLSAGAAFALPSPGDPGSKPPPPGPPHRSFGSASQSCSGSQSSIHCCNQSGFSPGKGPRGHSVEYGGYSYDMQCSQISSESKNPVQSICSTTVACCQGDGCVAIAE